jgi:hypothetical protein
MQSLRHELKYYCRKDIAETFIRSAGSIFEVDSFAKNRGWYLNRSLYFDTSNLNEYREYIDGEKIRRKYRLRSYDDQFNDCFIEIKFKSNDLVWKSRLKCQIDEAISIFSHPEKFRSIPEKEQFLAEIGPKVLRPTVAVSYQRIPLRDKLNGQVRVTLDYNLRCGGIELFNRQMLPTDKRIVPSNMCILEVKFPNMCPDWLGDLLKITGMSPAPFSKYAHAVDRYVFQRGVKHG